MHNMTIATTNIQAVVAISKFGGRSTATSSSSAARSPSERRCAGLGDFVVLIRLASAHADRADHVLAALQRNAATEDDDLACIGRFDPVKRLTRLGQRAEVFGLPVESACGEGL